MLLTVLLLCVYSLVVLYHITPELFQFQLITMGVGLAIFLVLRTIDSRVFQRLWIFWYIGMIVILSLSLFGPEVRGAHRWIEVGSQRIQPSEIVKPLLIVIFAAYLTQLKKFTLKEFAILTLLFSVPFFLVFKQPDLGNSLVYLAIIAILIILSDFGFKYVVIPTLLAVLGAPVVWHVLANYQKLRISTFLNPGYDIQGAGYNARQALIAVGSGGLWGKGLGQGTQSRLQFLPEFHTDFIFASTVEQLGFIGGFILLLLYFILLVQMVRASRGEDLFQKLMVYGIFSQIFIQVFINVGMNLGILPITGITLPLFSYGGSSVIATFVGLGIIASFRRKKKHPIAIR